MRIACYFGVVAVLAVSTAQEERQCQDKAADIVFMLDTSQQVGTVTWKKMISFLVSVVDRLPMNGGKQNNIGVAMYGSTSQVLIPLGNHYLKKELINEIRQLQYKVGESANLTAGLVALETVFKSPGVRKDFVNVAVLITASSPGVSRASVLPQATVVRKQGIRLFIVGINGRVDRVELRAIASDKDEDHFFYTKDENGLMNIVSKLTPNMCKDISLCTKSADVVLLLDTSGSVEQYKGQVVDFAKDLIQTLPVSQYNVRVAVITYSNQAHIEFDFDEHMTKEELLSNMDLVTFRFQNTNTSGAIWKARRFLFNRTLHSTTYGGRSEVRDVIIWVTDAASTKTMGAPLEEEAQLTHKAGIQIYAIGLPGTIGEEELNVVASDPDVSHVFELGKRAHDNVDQSIVLWWDKCEGEFVLCSNYIDLVVVLDGSGSIGDDNFNRMLNFVRTLIYKLDIDSGLARVGVVIYGESANVHIHLNTYILGDEAAAAILTVPYARGSTNTGEALQLVRDVMFTAENGDRPDVPNVALIITDGESNDQSATLRAARSLRDDGVTILTLGVGDPKWVRVPDLKLMASEPRSLNMYNVGHFDKLDEVVRDIQEATCNSFNECEKNPCENGGTCFDKVNGYSCQCQNGYAGKKCQTEVDVSSVYDIVFVVDQSGSVGEDNFLTSLDFVSELVNEIPFGTDPAYQTRVGLVSFSHQTNIHFRLDDYDNRDSIRNAIDGRYIRGSTGTHIALQTLREDLFMEFSGDRPNVTNLAILITDGKSTDPMSTWLESIKCREAGIELIVVSVGKDTSRMELRGIASGMEDENIYFTDSYAALMSLKSSILKDLYRTDDKCRVNPCQNGGTCEDGIGQPHCICKPNYFGLFCQKYSSKKMDIAFLVDNSGSITREKFPIVRSVASDIISNLDVGPGATRVGVVSFSNNARVEFFLDQYNNKYDAMHAMEMIPYQGLSTNTAAALHKAQDEVFDKGHGDRDEVDNVIVLITDGEPDDRDAVMKAAETSRIAGVTILVIGIGLNGAQKRQYSVVASEPQSRTIFSVESIKLLSTIVDPVVDTLIDDENYCSPNPCANGGACERLFLRHICQCMPRYTGYNCKHSCSNQLDVALVMDISMDMSKFGEQSKTLLHAIVDRLDFNFASTRLSYITFHDEVKVHFHLNGVTNKHEVMEKIQIPSKEDGTNLQNLMRALSEEVFVSANGDRSGVPNVAIVITDGNDKDSEDLMVDKSIQVLPIGMGDFVRREALDAINTDQASWRTVRIAGDEDVSYVVDALMDVLCN